MSSDPPCHLRPFTSMDLMELTSPRPGETKVGQRLRVAQATPGEKESTAALRRSLEQAREGGARFGLVAVPEDIGPRANYGRMGADEGPKAFLTHFANMQDNRWVSADTF